VKDQKYHDCTDEELMLLVASGSESSFEEVYRRYADRMCRFFYRRLYQDEQKAQDFTQDLFLKIVEKADLFNPGKSFVVWLYMLASNMCKNEYRRNALRGQHHGEGLQAVERTAASASTLNIKYDQELFHSSLGKELEKLPEAQRLTFIFRYQEDLSVRQISEILNCSEGTVKSRLYYTLKKLSRRLSLFDPHKQI
jgi:RNA polymerase sigma-70 factor (ECF subfamily)